MDEFDKKREIVQSLMDMLRKSSVDEVSPKESIEKISISPNSEKELHPAMDMDDNTSPMPDEMHDDMADMPAMADGGSIEEQDMDNNSSTPFEMLMDRKKRMR